jgi:AcrR family transcriptional regulator
MAASPPRGRRKKPANRYHHGDLRRALVEEALRMIRADGVGAMTLRAIGARLGVSRTALYRHFADKQALLTEVGREGFRMLRLTTAEAWKTHGGGFAGLEAMQKAYVRFAVTHPAHYKVIFGGVVAPPAQDAEFEIEAVGAFMVLVDALVSMQQQGLIRQDDPQLMARFVWADVHGTAMLAIDGYLRDDADAEGLNRYAIARIRQAIKVTASSE